MDKFVSAKELGEILGITDRRVYQLEKETKLFSRGISGKFEVVECVEKYYRQKLIPDEDKLNYDKEHTLLEKAKREKAELQLSKMKNELHQSEIVENVLSGMIITCRNRLISIPQKLAPQLIGLKNISKISEIIDIEIRSALCELSEYDPAMFVFEEGDPIENDTTPEEDLQKNNQ